MKSGTIELGRHAAMLQVVADKLRAHDLGGENGSLEDCSSVIESVAAALICAQHEPAELRA